MIVDIPPTFAPYLDEALLRFSYLYPGVPFLVEDGILSVDCVDAEVLTSIRHTLYRQKIYRETESLRRRMLESLLR